LNGICLRIIQFDVVFAQYLRRKRFPQRKKSILQCGMLDHRLKVAIGGFRPTRRIYFDPSQKRFGQSADFMPDSSRDRVP
jgi:hypothetical protein